MSRVCDVSRCHLPRAEAISISSGAIPIPSNSVSVREFLLRLSSDCRSILTHKLFLHCKAAKQRYLASMCSCVAMG